MSLASLKTFLNIHSIPVIANQTGFLEIIGKQYHENINSALYAHFINSQNEEVKSLFVDSLLELVCQKSGKTLSMKGISAQTEVNTGNGRIDILIRDNQGDDVIIIENKIYHWLHNDLLDYWNFINIDANRKVGVLLTLNSHFIPEEVDDKFINITHFEWISLIESRVDSHNLPLNYHVYVTDFINTIKNLTTSYKMNESTKFYFQHAEEVLKAQQTMYEAHTFINNQFQLIADTIGWQTFGNSLEWRNFWDADNNLDTYLTIITKDLLAGKMHYRLILELNRENKARETELLAVLSSHPQKAGKKRGESKGNYLHYLCKDYFISPDELERFAEIVVQNIREDFADMTLKVIRHFYDNKDISKWENKFLGTLIEEA